MNNWSIWYIWSGLDAWWFLMLCCWEICELLSMHLSNYQLCNGSMCMFMYLLSYFRGNVYSLKEYRWIKSTNPQTKLSIHLLAQRKSTNWVISGHLKYLRTLCIALLYSAVYKSLKKTNGSEGKKLNGCAERENIVEAQSILIWFLPRHSWVFLF